MTDASTRAVRLWAERALDAERRLHASETRCALLEMERDELRAAAARTEPACIAMRARVAELEAEVAGLRSGADLHRSILERLRAEVPDPEGET